MHDGSIESLTEEIRSDTSFLSSAPYEERMRFHAFVRKQHGRGWEQLGQEGWKRETRLYLERIVSEIKQAIGEDAWRKANNSARTKFFVAKLASITELRYGGAQQEQHPSEPVSRELWLQRYANLLSPGEADAGYASYVRKVKAGIIKP